MSVESLADRYGIKLANIRARLACLSLSADDLSAEDLDKLDALDAHLKAGNSISTFVYTPTSAVQIMPSAESHLAPIAEELELPDFESLSKLYQFLQNAADNGWHLPTSVIRQLTGSTPRGPIWKRFGFEFIPATRHGAEKAWAVQLATWDFPIVPGG